MFVRVGLMILLVNVSRAEAGEPPDFVKKMTPPAAVGPVLFAFNGKDLDGFSTYLRYRKEKDPALVFSVVDGCLRISGEEFGGITTKPSFADYHLVAEWRWGGKTYYPRRWRARNSGILIHCSGLEGDGLGAWMAGLESQIIEGGCGDLILVPGKDRAPGRLEAEVRTAPDGRPYYQPGGTVVTRAGGRLNWWGRDPGWTDVIWFRGPDDLDRPFGEWNRTELVCEGDRVTCFVNGRVANAASRLSMTAGRILFQSEGAEILFRKIEVRSLPPKLDGNGATPSRPAGPG